MGVFALVGWELEIAYADVVDPAARGAAAVREGGHEQHDRVVVQEDRRLGEHMTAQRRVAAENEADLVAQTLGRDLTVSLDPAQQGDGFLFRERATVGLHVDRARARTTRTRSRRPRPGRAATWRPGCAAR